jgi:hypothetical protein
MSPPGAKNMMECYTPMSKPSACAGEIRTMWKNMLAAEQTASEARQVAFVDTTNWFCSLGKCPSFVGTTAIYADSVHLTTNFSTALGPVLVEKLRELAVVD